jgi:hypothetical protein
MRTCSRFDSALARRGLLHLRHARKNAELILHVMADLVGNHVGLGELAGVAVRTAAELVLQIVEERGIEVDALIARAVERSHGRLREGAWRRLGAREQAQLRRMIGAAVGGENFRPAVLGVAQHQGDKLAGRVAAASRQ